MKTTFDILDELMVRAKKRVAEGLRTQLAGPKAPSATRPAAARRIRWVTAAGGLPPGLDLTSRAQMHEWLGRHR